MSLSPAADLLAAPDWTFRSTFHEDEALMMTPLKVNTKPLINKAALALLAAYVLTTIHHIYGGLVDNAQDRLFVPVILAPVIVIAIVSLYQLGRSGSRAALITFGIVALLWVLLLGVLHGGYAHLYKDIVFLVGGSPHLYYSLNPSEHYPPDNAFFEVTGVLDLVAAAFVAQTALGLLQAGHEPSQVVSAKLRSSGSKIDH